MNRMQQHNAMKQSWISDLNNKKYTQVKTNFFAVLNQQANKDGKIGYYDFLLVAKKLSFRFEESSHLMALKNFFSKNKNLVTCKKLSDCLSISQDSLIGSNNAEEKIIVKFNVPDVQFAPIKEETLQDQDFDSDRSMKDGHEQEQQLTTFQKMGKQSDPQHERQLMQKMSIILSIKVQQMHKKLLMLTHLSGAFSLLTYFDSYEQQEISYQVFKKGIIEIISNCKEKLKLSQDDVKTIFHLLDEEKRNFVTVKDIERLRNLEESGLAEKMRHFYKSRLNRDMVKNTLFKLGKVKSNSIQIYQLKNASLMQFKQMEDAIINHSDKPSTKGFNIRTNRSPKQRNRIPHFGPLKGAAKWRNAQNPHSRPPQQSYSQPNYNNLYTLTHPHNPTSNIFSINKQRQKIQKILRQSKDVSSSKFSTRPQKNGQTVASKLRSLFIHKVILPREKMLQQQKDKFLRCKVPQHQLSIKPLK